MIVLATEFSTAAINQSVAALGVIGAFIVVVTVFLVTMYKFILSPELTASRNARANENEAQKEIAKGFAATSENMKDTIAAAERMQAQAVQMFERFHLLGEETGGRKA